jgi:hypothetical protein
MGIFDRLFSRPRNSGSGPMTDYEAVKVINTYGKALIEHKSAYGDLSELPHRKERIKEALIHRIKAGGDPKFREQLKGAYIALAQWQLGFAARRAAAELTEEDLKDPTKTAARMLTMGG